MNIGKLNKWWLGGIGILVLCSGGWWWYLSKQNQEIIDNIMKAVGKGNDPLLSEGAEKFGDSRDLGISKIFSTSFWKTNPNRVSIWAANQDGTAGPAIKFSNEIFDAGGPFALSPTRGAKVVAVFKSLKTKEDVSKLADVFYAQHKTDLYNYINQPYMTGNCSPEQDTCYLGIQTNYLKQVYDIIQNQLT